MFQAELNITFSKAELGVDFKREKAEAVSCFTRKAMATTCLWLSCIGGLWLLKKVVGDVTIDKIFPQLPSLHMLGLETVKAMRLSVKPTQIITVS
ncbi:hypothetical protein SAY87_022201 [Trapa incisa]|uniref:Uncharacterized protein n=1 Tax=Trapa incisa TaxID=236973 RepID=A0AAN7JSW6_9MYRT|nr:hypothetical protein SAY87_022201 [Trapa incisa]